ncbi:hypothetical protein IT400_03490 [Candidatus Nomurabacteria bacterium]|nr:hypothetical protein [Candidatus Nomurabacteria bacterium]
MPKDSDFLKNINPQKPDSFITSGGIEKPPSAFIKDPKMMEYLEKTWNHYAENDARDIRTQTTFSGLSHSEEVFDSDPSQRYGGIYEAMTRYTLVDQKESRLFKENAERMHGVNFFNEIKNKIDEKKSKNDNKPVNILITGSDVGFLNDELRYKFGKDVTVCGTTLEVSRAQRRKRYFLKLIKNGKTQLSPESVDYLGKALKEKIDPCDRKWRSILEMEDDKPEFDKIIDTCGELLYSFDYEKPEIFELTFKACISKLNPGGKLYVSEMYGFRYIEEYCKEKNLIIEKNNYDDRHQNLKTNYIITKPENSG